MKKLAADIRVFLGRAFQFTEEKCGQAEKTEFDAHWENLSKTECTKHWTEKIMRQTEVLLQPNAKARIEEFVYEKLDRKAPSRMNNPELLDQTGFIPNRQLIDNVRRTIDITHEKKYLVLALDFKKAFDSIEVPYMITLLRGLGFGANFLKAIHTLSQQS
ncbi:UNVERIFIED_CONTAM: hypothetical protein K2H54_075202 [Gekko kuhli]